MAKKKIERFMRYSRKVFPGEQIRGRNRWTFFIVNEPREIHRIRERIYEQLAPVWDLYEIIDSSIEGTNGLHYQAFSLSSDSWKVEGWAKVYDSKKLRRDRDLREGDDFSMSKYAERLLELGKD